MFKRKMEKHSYIPTFTAGIIMLACCILVCIFHILNSVNQYSDQVYKNMMTIFRTSAAYVTEQVEKELQTVELAADFLSAEKGAMKEADMKNLVEQYSSTINGFYGFAYIDEDGNKYTSGNLKWNAILGDKAGQTIVYAPSVKVRKGYGTSEDEYGVLLYMVPIGKDEGTLFAVQSTKEILEESGFQYISHRGNVYLLDRDGYILTSKTKAMNRGKEGEYLNFINLLKRKTLENRQNANVISDLSSGLRKQGLNEYKLTLDDGAETYIALQKIQGAQELYLAFWYPDTVYWNEISPMIIRNIMAAVILVILMLGMYFSVWHYTNRNRKVIERLAYMDPITKGVNYNFFLERASEILHQGDSIPYIVGRFDISNFRYINEAYGHIRADELLSVVIEEGQKICGERELISRMNADQFVLLVQNISSFEEKHLEFEESINKHAKELGIRFPIKLKSGMYQVRRGDTDIDVMVDRANAARKSLADKKNTSMVAFYSDKIVNEMRKVDKIESEMEKALENGEFQVYLQPKWDIKEDKFYGAEALVRWIKEDGSMVYPDVFIPLFEQNGFIEQLDYYMLESTCREIKHILDEGKEPFPISVNQSRRLWDNPDYVANVKRIIDEYEVPKHYIDLEVTESVFLGDQDKIISIIKNLKEQDIAVSMDDFGSGYSSLNLLKDIPFDMLKIDREFFSEAVTSKSSTWILQKIVEMAEGLGIHVLCEGVESLEQIEILRKIGCDFAQGYYFSKPISVIEFKQKYVGADK